MNVAAIYDHWKESDTQGRLARIIAAKTSGAACATITFIYRFVHIVNMDVEYFCLIEILCICFVIFINAMERSLLSCSMLPWNFSTAEEAYTSRIDVLGCNTAKQIYCVGKLFDCACPIVRTCFRMAYTKHISRNLNCCRVRTNNLGSSSRTSVSDDGFGGPLRPSPSVRESC